MLHLHSKKKSELNQDYAKRILQLEGIAVEGMVRASLSYTNDVFKINLKGKEHFLKFFTDQWNNKNAGDSEIEIMKILNSNGIPAPRVVFFRKSKEGRNYCLMEGLPGNPMMDMLNKNTPISDRVIDESLSILKIFSEIKGRFGFFSHDPRIHITYDNYFDFINDVVIDSLIRLNKRGHEIHNLVSLIKSWKRKESHREFSFCHNDFTPKHILTDGNSITGIIDYEWSAFGNSVLDYVRWLTALAQHKIPYKNLSKIYLGMPSGSAEIIPYYAARVFILEAAWPHKAVEQPYYSDIRLSLAKMILDKGEVSLDDLLWQGKTGIIGEIK